MRANLTSATPKIPANEIAYRTVVRQGKLKGAVKEHRMRAVGYVRVSTMKQAEEGVSLDAQRVRIKAHCLSQGIMLVDIITDDGKSAVASASDSLFLVFGFFEPQSKPRRR